MLIGLESSAAGAESGGDTTYVRGLLGGLATVDHSNDYRLFDIRSHPFYTTLPERFGLWRLRRPHSLLRLFTSLPVAMRRAGVALIHAQYFLPAWLKTPSVVTIHDLHFEHFPEHYPSFDSWFLRQWVSRSARRAQRIITGSGFSQRDIHQRYGIALEKIVVIAYGLNARFRPERDEQRLQFVRGKYGVADRFILFIGRLADPRKNVALLMEAFLQLDPAVARPYQLVLAGPPGGVEFQRLLALASAQGRGQVIFPGFVADEDLPALLSAATALIFPSLFEGFGLPVLEAMACGTPVATSDAASLPEVAGDAALFFDPRDKLAIAQSIQRLMSDAALREHLRDLGIQRAAGFSWEVCARRTLTVYEAAFAGRPTDGC